MEQIVSRVLYAIAYRFDKPLPRPFNGGIGAANPIVCAYPAWRRAQHPLATSFATPPNKLPLWAMALSVTDLACARGPAQVLANVSFSVEAGEALILRGPNGAGKTTLLRTLAGLTPPLNGRVSHEAGAIAYAAHADGLKAQLSVAENLAFWAGIFGTDDLDPAIFAFDLAPLLHRRAADLSAGQKRRLSLARLLVTGRPIWCLDEPTVSLDAENTARFAAAVEAHLARGGTAVIATHIDLGLPNARTLDISPFVAKGVAADDPFAEALS